MRPELWRKLLFLKANPASISSNPLTQEEIIGIFEEYDAVWLHDGNSAKPHAELTSGKCSNGYFNCSKVLCYPAIAELFARHLVQKLGKYITRRAGWVIGSPYAGITFSYEAAKLLGAAHGFTEKDPKDPKKMLWKRWQIPKGSEVLQIEELITTLKTAMSVREAAEKGNKEEIKFMPVIGTLVHRPPEFSADYAGLRIVSLIEKQVWAVEPSECPLCAKGSKRLKPKSHWAELTA